MLRNIFRVLFGSFKRDKHPANYGEELVSRYDLRRRASELGEQRLPPHDTGDLSEPEQEVAGEVRDKIDGNVEALANQRAALEAQVAQFRRSAAAAREALHPKSQDIKVALDDINARSWQAIQGAAAHAETQQLAYRGFQGTNRIFRLPEFPISLFKHFSVVFVLLVFESAINTVFYARVLSGGGVEGFLLAVMIATVNIGCAIALGFFSLRWLNHINKAHRYWAAPVGIFLLTSIIIINGFAAHLREFAMAASRTGALLDLVLIVRRLLTLTFQLATESYALFTFGVVCAIYAIWKGYTASDAYPGYAAYYKRMSAAMDDYSTKKEEVRKASRARCDGELKSAKELLDDCEKAFTTCVEAGHRFIVDTETCNRMNHQLTMFGNTAIAVFRQTNTFVRRPERAPEYFAKPALEDVPAEAVPAHLAPDEIQKDDHQLMQP
jgi:hypothetical protein